MRTGLRSGLCGACDQRGSPLHSIASALPSQRTPPGLSPPPAFPQRGGGASLCSTDAGLRPPASSRWSPDTHDSYSRLAGSRMPLLQIVPNARLGTERCDKSHPSPTPYKQNMSFSCQLTPGSASIQNLLEILPRCKHFHPTSQRPQTKFPLTPAEEHLTERENDRGQTCWILSQQSSWAAPGCSWCSLTCFSPVVLVEGTGVTVIPWESSQHGLGMALVESSSDRIKHKHF